MAIGKLLKYFVRKCFLQAHVKEQLTIIGLEWRLVGPALVESQPFSQQALGIQEEKKHTTTTS